MKISISVAICLVHLLVFPELAQGRGYNQTLTVGFWNIFAQGNSFKAIIDEQRRVIESSGLMSRLDILYYATMGNKGSSLQLPGKKMVHLKDYGLHGSELHTLNELFSFCNYNPLSKVLYFHNKGSLNFNTLNTNFRRALDCFILNPHCIDALEKGYDTCGWRLSPLPHVHYSGNYWWATCKHINRLIPPTSPQFNRTFISLTGALYARNQRTTVLPSIDNPLPDQPHLGLGRYFAETWVSSLPVFFPSDCMNATVNNRYMWGKFPLPWRMVNKRCPNYKDDFMLTTVQYNTNRTSSLHDTDKELSKKNYLTYGLPCGTAGFITQPHLVKKRFTLSSANFTKELYNRSMIWYGQPPKLHIAWLKLYDET